MHDIARQGLVLLIATTLGLAGGGWPAVAVEVTPEISVEVLPSLAPQTQRPSGQGYLEYRFRVINHAATAAHRVELRLPDKDFTASADHMQGIYRAVEVPARTQVEVTLLQPALPLYGNSAVRVIVDGREQARLGHDMPMANRHCSNHSSKLPVLLVSRRLNGEELEKAVNQAVAAAKPAEPLLFGKANNSNSTNVLLVQSSELEPARWSENWLAYTPYNAVVLHADDWASLRQEAATALRCWLEAGGTLLVAGAFEAPADWRLLPSGGWLAEAAALTAHQVGWGTLVQTGSMLPHQLPTADLTRLQAHWQASLWDDCRSNARDLHQGFLARANADVPVGVLLLLVALFAIGIGPVNLYLLHRRQQLIHLLWIIPLISLLTTGAIAAYAFFSEGVTPYVRALGVTVLDQPAQRAVSIGRVAYYCPLTPGDGLHFRADTEVLPLLPANNSTGMGGREVDWSRRQHFTRGWAAARMPVSMLLRRSESRRERLEVRAGANGELSVVNGLGAGIRRLLLADAAGRVFRTDAIAAGSKQVLGEQTAGFSSSQRQLALPPLHNYKQAQWMAGELRDNPQRWLAPNTYIAVLETSPFLETGLDYRRCHRETQHVVLGYWRETP